MTLARYTDILLNMVGIFIRNVPENLRNCFKAMCNLKGTTMQEALIKLMEKDINESVDLLKDYKLLNKT